MTTRRQFLRTTGAAAAALTIGGVALPIGHLIEAAGAQAAPKLTDEDFGSFAESVELAAIAAYNALRARVTRPPALAALATATQHHQAHASALAPLGGAKRFGQPNPMLLQTLTDQLGQARDEDHVIQVAFDLENALAGTHLFLLGSFTNKAGLVQSGTILPAESAHAVLLGTTIGKAAKDLTAPDLGQTGFETQDKHIDPATFPTAVATTTTTIKK